MGNNKPIIATTKKSLELNNMTYKRYQYYAKDGIQWTNWFPWNSDIRDKWQFKNKLLNEYEERN